MPDKETLDNTSGSRPCDGNATFNEMRRLMPTCMNCRKAVEESLTRVAGRKLRRMRSLPSCSVERCAEFLSSVGDAEMRFHLASMAWWRFSSEEFSVRADAIRDVMVACHATRPPFGEDYMRRAIRVLSPLSSEQLSVWFGCENLFQAVDLFLGGTPAADGRNCSRCRLLKQGCTRHDKIGADECRLWEDRFVQGVAAEIARTGGYWRDPCSRVKEER